MKVMIITSSPNAAGLTAACGESARQGAMEGGAQVIPVKLNDLNIGQCNACDNGWGTCFEHHECQLKDDFQELHKSMGYMDAYIIITPVYWGEMSESAKAFFDRLRRCEATKKDQNFIQGKPIIAIAAAGGGGGGVVSCLASMERFVSHVKGVKFDLIGITRKSREYTLDTIKNAAKKMVKDQQQNS
jgi:multimeric flavodoxin WrbA